MSKDTVYLLGIDAGTTSLKVALFDGVGRMQAIDRQEYRLETPAPAVVELDPQVYWDSLCRATRAVLQQSQVRPEAIAALSISSQGETLLAVDGAGQPLRKAIIWMDNRATAEAEELARQFDVEEIYHVTGQPEIAPVWPATKILWIKNHEPDVFARTARFMMLEDYLHFCLTGRFVTDLCIQSDALYLDMQNRRWWQPMLDVLGISADRLGDLLEPGQVVGPVCARAAAETGLSIRTVTVTGGMDQLMGAIGAGNIAPGVVAETTGGALALTATLDTLLFDPQRRIPVQYHALPGRYALMPWSQTAGMALKWFRDQFFTLEGQVAQASGLDAYDLMVNQAAQVPPGSDGLVVLPHLEGAACPEFNPAAKAVFFGATLRHTRAHFVRAIMESVACMLKKNLALIEDLGIEVHEVRCMGGAARSELWLQIKADLLQKPVATLEAEDAALLGAAVLSAVATGVYPTLEDAVSHMVRLSMVIPYNPDHAEVYQKTYQRYLDLYDHLAPLF
jgi:sugar (pentulose or hexulose) kinase